MRRMISETKAKVLDNLAVNKDGTVIEVGGNVALESPEQIGHYIDTLHRVHCIIDAVIGTNNPVVLVEGATKIIPVGDWIDVSTNPDLQVPPIENGQVVYVQGDKMLYKLNGTTFYSEVNNSLVCDGTITEPWGKKWQGMGYIQEGGRVFQPLISQPKEAQLINVGNTYYMLLDDAESSQAYYISMVFQAGFNLCIQSLDGPIEIVLGTNFKGYNNINRIDSANLGIWSNDYSPTDNGYGTIIFGEELRNVYVIVSNRIVYVNTAYEV